MNNLVSAEEQARIARGICTLLNSCEYLPANKVDFEYLGETGLSMVVNSSSHITRRFILGGYEAQLNFTLVYRVFAESNDERLEADEVLNSLAAWLEGETVSVEHMTQKSLRRDTSASLATRYENGAEDHEINMTLLYEV